MKKVLTEEEYKMLETEGVCEDCGTKGYWCIDPYIEELYGEEQLTCLCDVCYDAHVQEI